MNAIFEMRHTNRQTGRQTILYNLSSSTSSLLTLHKLSVEPAIAGVCRTQIEIVRLSEIIPEFCGATHVWQTLCTSHTTWRNRFSFGVSHSVSPLLRLHRWNGRAGISGGVVLQTTDRGRQNGGGVRGQNACAHTQTHTHPVFISVCLEGVCVC